MVKKKKVKVTKETPQTAQYPNQKWKNKSEINVSNEDYIEKKSKQKNKNGGRGESRNNQKQNSSFSVK